MYRWILSLFDIPSLFYRACFIIYASCLFICHLPIFGKIDYLATQARLQELFIKYESSVVRVKATRQDLTSENKKRILKMGSGFFVSKDGHILTTGLLLNPERVWIEHKNKFFLTEVLGSDDLCNLTLLKTLEKPSQFSYVSFSNNKIETPVGSFLLGLTCALEFEIGPSIGLLQSVETSFGRNLFPTRMIRSSLSLGPGEVGGPVFDLNGNFVGIAHAVLPDLRSSFILPANACSKIRDGLLLSGKVDYGWFGITVSQKLNNENSSDIVIQTVDENSKLQEGDILLKIGSNSISERRDIVESTFFARPGTFVDFFVLREGNEMRIPVRVLSRPKSKQEQAKDDLIVDSNNSNLGERDQNSLVE